MYRIGQLAKLSGLTPETIRFYEKEGLLKEPERMANGYRLYSTADLGRLKFILRGKSAGLSNADMSELVTIRETPDAVSCRDVRDVIDNKLSIVREQIRELQKLEQSLAELSSACCGGDESAVHCSILEELDDLIDTRDHQHGEHCHHHIHPKN